MKNWYIVQSHSSFENKVAKEIKEEAAKANLNDKIEEIIVPTHDITEVKGKKVKRKIFSGYVLLKSEMDNTIYHMIKNLKKVSGFLGTRYTNTRIWKRNRKILGQIKDGVVQPNLALNIT